MSQNTACKRCGTCCRQGGPALHGPDLDLIRSGRLRLDDLITVRRGELAIQPLASGPESVTQEFVKLAGQDGNWCCIFFDAASNGCKRYDHRPMACGLLDCTDTGPLLAIAGQDLLTRLDCLDLDNPLRSFIEEHEHITPWLDMGMLGRDLQHSENVPTILAGLETAVARDLRFREHAVSSLHLSLGSELFAFGRPLFQLLLVLGVHTRNSHSGIRLTFVDH